MKFKHLIFSATMLFGTLSGSVINAEEFQEVDSAIEEIEDMAVSKEESSSSSKEVSNAMEEISTEIAATPLPGNHVSKIAALRSQFPDGWYWNHEIKKNSNGSDESKRVPTGYAGTHWTDFNDPCNAYESVTQTPCGYDDGKWHGAIESSNNGFVCNNYENAFQCAGFAKLLFAKYNCESTDKVPSTSSGEDIRAGDMVLMKLSTGDHYAFVIGVGEKQITVAEANYGYHCKIRWDGKYDRKDVVTVWHGGSNQLYRVYNPNSGEHFYTKSMAEREFLHAVGWKDEGNAWMTSNPNGNPMYRLYNPNNGEHHYTLNKNEKNFLCGIGWKDEGIAWYSSDNKSKPVYREYNPNAKVGSHNLTVNSKEHNALVSFGWKDEGVSCYAN